jgi:SAM-dependent methyltransferase
MTGGHVESVGEMGLKSWEEAVRWLMNEPGMQELAKAAYFDEPLTAARRYHASAEFKTLKELLPHTPGRALDLGAGNGILSWALAKEGWHVTAVEPDPSKLIGAGAIRMLTTEPGVSIEVVEAFGESIPAEPAGYDLVVARQVLHHAKDLSAFCQEMARLGKKGARVVTLRDHVVSDAAQRAEFLKTHPMHKHYGGENAFRLEEYRRAIESAGILIEKQYLSFQSVLNFDPTTVPEVKDKIAGLAGPLSPVLGIALKAVPDQMVLNMAAAMDRRPGRLVSFVGVVN